MFLRQSTSQVIRFGPALDITDGVSEETALTLAQADMRLSKDGGAFAQKNAAGNATHDSDGWYSTTLNATDTDTVGILKLNVHQPANMLPIWETFYVIEEAIYDLLYGAGSTGLVTLAAVTHTGAVIPTVTTLTGHTAQTGDSFARLGAPAGASVSADIADVPTVAELNARTLLAANYFDPAADTVALVTDLTNLPSIPANWLTAAGINAAAFTNAKFAAGAIDANALAADAVDEIRDGVLPTQNTAFNNIPVLFVAASDHVTPVTGATGTAVTRSIDGGAFGSGTGTFAEIGNGLYQYDASAADMNGGLVVFRFTATGGTPGAPDDVFIPIVTGGGV